MYGSYSEFNAAKLVCRACPIGLVYDRVVASDGCLARPVVMVIGEAPGADEVAKGKPFVGKSGRLLRDALNSAGFNRDNTAISNVIPCRPKDNAFPSDGSIVESCVERWLWQEIDLLKPSLVLIVGGKALKFVLGMDGITRNRGRWIPMTRTWGIVDCMPTWHPSYVQRVSHMEDGKCVADEFKMDIAEVARVAGFMPPRHRPIRTAG